MLEGFAAARGRIRSLVAERVPTKVTPELVFEVDPSVDEGARIDHALRAEAKAERKLARHRDRHAVERAESYAGTAAQGPTAQAATYATPDAAAPDTAHGTAAGPAAPSDAGEAS